VTNSGPNDATGVSVLDELPSGFQYLSDDAAASGGSYAPGTGLWSIGALSATAPNNTVVLNITARVNATGNRTNVAQVWTSDSLDPDSTPGNNVPTEDDYDSVTVPVLPVSDLSLNKLFTSYSDNDLSGNLSGGDTVTFTLNLNNAGPNTATGVVVQDQLPAGYTYLSHLGPGTFNGATGLWNVGSINVLETKTLILNATINIGFDPATGAYRNYAQVLASNSFDPDSTPGNNSTTEDDDATATPLISNVSLGKNIALAPNGDLDGTGGPSHNDLIVFTLTASNSGPDLATGVVVQDVLPAGFTYVSDNGGSNTSYDTFLLDPNDSNTEVERITWNVGTIGTLTPRTLQITATLVGGLNPTTGAYTNYAQVTASDNFDPNSTPGNNSTNEDDDAVVTLPMADLSVTKSIVLTEVPDGDLDGSDSITVGDIVDFAIKVSNAGPDLATGVIVTDQLPAGYAYLSDSSGGTYNLNNGQWSVGAIAAGGNATLVIRASVVSASNLTNVAQVTASGVYDPDSTPNNNNPNEDDYFSVTPTLGQAADLELDKTFTGFIDADTSGGLSPGDRVTFLLTLTNNGPNNATGVTVRDQLGAGFTYFSHSGDGTYNSGSGIWTLPDPVESGDSFTLELTATLLGGFQPADYSNYAQVWTSGVWDPDSTPGDNSTDQDDDALAVLQVADLSITKTNNQTTAVPGLPTTYTIVVTNQGPANVAGAIVQDTFPAALLNPTYTSIVVGTGSGNTLSGSGNIFDVVSLAAGSSIVYTVTGTVSPSATGTLSNTATVTSPPNIPDLNPNNNTATDTDPLTPRADLSILKTDGQTSSTPGTPITYTIVVSNAGPSAVTGASVQDIFPAELLGPSYVSLASGGATGNTVSGSGNINDTVNMPVGSQILYIVSATVSPSATGTLTNTATVSPPSGVTDPNPGNNLSTDTNTLLPPPAADVGVLKNVNLVLDADGSSSVTAGDTVQFTITVFNAGPSSATGITVQDVVPAGYTNIQNITGGGLLSGNTITWSGLSLPATPGLNSLTLTFTATVTGTRSYTNPVQITAADQIDPNPANNQTSVTPVVQLVSDLSLAKSVVLLTDADASGNISAGDTVRFSVVLSNAGPDEVTGASVVDNVPAGYTNLTVVSGGGVYNPLNDTITWTGLNVAAGSSTTLIYDAVILGGLDVADYLNYAQVTSSPNFDPDSTPGNGNGVTPVEDDEASTRPAMSNLSLTKDIALITDADGTGGYSGGDTVQFTLTVSNAGPDCGQRGERPGQPARRIQLGQRRFVQPGQPDHHLVGRERAVRWHGDADLHGHAGRGPAHRGLHQLRPDRHLAQLRPRQRPRRQLGRRRRRRYGRAANFEPEPIEIGGIGERHPSAEHHQRRGHDPLCLDPEQFRLRSGHGSCGRGPSA
jgi:large repetitive protein